MSEEGNRGTGTNQSIDDRGGRRIIILVLLYLLLAIVIVLHLLVLHFQMSVPFLFMICVVLAAWRLRPVSTAVYSAFALAGLTFHSWLDAIPVGNWALDFLTVATTAVLSVWIAYESRKQRALAVENAAIATQLSEEARRTAIFARASQLFASSIELDRVLQTVVQETTQELGDLVGIWLFDEGSKDLQLQTIFTRDPDLIAESQIILTRLSLDVGVTGVVARTGKAVLLPDARAPEVTGGMRIIIDALGARSVLSVPLLSRGRMIGVMTAAILSGERRYDRDDLILAEELAALAGASINNAQLFSQQEALVAQLQESGQEREQLLGMITHEIAGMLTVISGYAQLALKDARRKREVNEKSLMAIQSQTRKLSRLVHDLRDISRIERGGFELKLTQCDISAIVKGIANDQQALTADHIIVLSPDSGPVPGCWDCDRLAQAVSNLVRNAVNYSPPGKTVWVAVNRNDGWADISVRDEGLGIEKEDLPKLFKPYSRLEHTGRVKGTGLGLFITKAIVEAHHGSIEVQSEPGVGSTFTIHLPITSDVPGSCPET